MSAPLLTAPPPAEPLWTPEPAATERPAPAATVAGVRRPERYSASTINDAARCLLMHRFKREHDRTGDDAITGTAFHEVAATVAFRAGLLGEREVDLAYAQRAALKVLSRPNRADPYPLATHRIVMDLIAKWAVREVFHPDADEYGVELDLRVPLGDHIISGRIDRLEVFDGVADVIDYKTGARPLNDDEMAAHVPSHVYAWLVWRAFPDVHAVRPVLRYVRAGRDCLVPGGVLEGPDLADVEEYLEVAAARLDHAWDRHEFPPRDGAWCARCPRPDDCTIPARLRPESQLQTIEDAHTAASAYVVARAALQQREQQLRAFLEDGDLACLVIGDQEVGYRTGTKKSLNRRAAERAYDLSPYITESSDTRWGVHKAP